MASADDQLKNWFFYLQSMQSAAAKINASTPTDLSAFAKAKVTSLLPSQPQQDQFIQLVENATGLFISADDLKNATTFSSLVTSLYIAQYTCLLRVFKFVVGDTTTPEPQFELLLVTNVFNPTTYSALVDHLQSDIPAACLTQTQLNNLKTLMSSPTANVKQAVQAVSLN